MPVFDPKNLAQGLSARWKRLPGISLVGPANSNMVGKLFIEADLPKISDLMQFYMEFPCMEGNSSRGDQNGFRLWDLGYMADNYKVFRKNNTETDLVPFADVDEHSFFYYFKIRPAGNAEVFTDLDDFNTPVASSPSEFISLYLEGKLKGL